MSKIFFYLLLVLLLENCKQIERKETTNVTRVAKKAKQNKVLTITVNDTDFSKGRLGLHHKLDITDLEKFHGHLCDGLVVGFLGIKEGLEDLYPNGIIDRTNTRIVSKSSPCLTDAAIFITGGRYQFNSFYVSNSIDDGFYIIQRIDTKETVKVKMRKGVKPTLISEMGAKAIKGELTECALDKLHKLENNFTKKLLNSNPKDNFAVLKMNNFKWNPILLKKYIKTDIINKNKLKCNQK